MLCGNVMLGGYWTARRVACSGVPDATLRFVALMCKLMKNRQHGASGVVR